MENDKRYDAIFKAIAEKKAKEVKNKALEDFEQKQAEKAVQTLYIRWLDINDLYTLLMDNDLNVRFPKTAGLEFSKRPDKKEVFIRSTIYGNFYFGYKRYEKISCLIEADAGKLKIKTVPETIKTKHYIQLLKQVINDFETLEKAFYKWIDKTFEPEADHDIL